MVQPTPHARKQYQRNQADRGDSDGDEPIRVGEALRREKNARPVDGNGSGQLVRPIRVLVWQPRGVGGGEHEADLVEAKQDFDLGRHADSEVVIKGEVCESEGRADASLLAPALLHHEGPHRQAAHDAEGEGNGGDLAGSRADGETLVTFVALDEMVLVRDAELALWPGEASGAVLVRARLLQKASRLVGSAFAAGAPRHASTVAPKVAARRQHGGGGACAPVARWNVQGLESGAVRAFGVWRTGFAVVGRGAEDVGRVGVLDQVEALLADGAGDVAALGAEGVGAESALALAGVGGVGASSALIARVATWIRVGSRGAVHALTSPGLAAKRPSAAARARLPAACASDRAGGSAGALRTGVE